ncbi:hypothetical protein B5S28_g2277 [[Candida] boidinii]|uniref:Unnamed protein product n=1 Tax=Candida boidinii TaxID=5477 RepID=A0ACB5THZ8_CANBO|nr:hypothetical protein B5S28_g2277 [[Candida] boidinii]OWB59326.1 hypothetical protein B5S29_g181 [[Candida] boidinii]OWB70338.1 hypothetical protein B5S31_g15 [[Candida] boidinii]GME88655.1 unnamed protein product [[Candida] boidinii]GMF56745.1 unnamed protein product [[Candida] boidinii]
MSGKFVLGSDSEKQALRSLKALKAHISSEFGPKNHEAVYAVINTTHSTIAKNDYTPRILPIPNKLGKVTSQKILLVTKDPSNVYREKISEKGSATEDIFDSIISFKKLRSIAHSPKSLKKLSYEYDLIVCDHRVHHLLHPILGPTFYKSNKKLVFMVQMAKPDPEAQLVRGKKSHKLKDERCEPEYILKQIKSIVRNSSFVPSTGSCLSVIIGYTDFEAQALTENLNATIDYLTNKAKFGPVGGIIKNGVKGIVDVHVKTSESASLPVLEKDRSFTK